MRNPRGNSIAAARAKDSIAPLTMLAEEPKTIGSRDSTPAMSVIEPSSRSTSRAAKVRLTWPISLLAMPRPYDDSAIEATEIALSG